MSRATRFFFLLGDCTKFRQAFANYLLQAIGKLAVTRHGFRIERKQWDHRLYLNRPPPPDPFYIIFQSSLELARSLRIRLTQRSSFLGLCFFFFFFPSIDFIVRFSHVGDRVGDHSFFFFLRNALTFLSSQIIITCTLCTNFKM